MARIFSSPHVIDGILLLAILEGVVLILARRRMVRTEARRVRPVAIVLMLLPGMCLMLAIRAALDDAAWPWVPAALFAALVAHVADIRERWFG